MLLTQALKTFRCAFASLRLCVKSLQPWRRRFQRCGPCIRAFYFQLPLVDFVAARREESIEVRPAERNVRHSSVRRLNDAVYAAGLVADLNAQAGCNIEAAIAVDPDPVRAAVVRCIGGMKPVVALLERRSAVRLIPVSVDPVRAIIGHIKQ